MFAVSVPTSGTVPDERRRGYRYSITAMAKLRLVGSGKRAEAVIHNISSSGAFFTAEINLVEGKRVELVVDWPVHLNGRIPLALVLLGTVRRSDSTGTAIKINRYEWKIRARTRAAIAF
jgi:hypothetical protein